MVDRAAHIEQVSFTPEQERRGKGRALIDQAEARAAESGLAALTLTTFGHIPRNQPLYEHLGFRVLAGAQIGPRLQAMRDAEATHASPGRSRPSPGPADGRTPIAARVPQSTPHRAGTLGRGPRRLARPVPLSYWTIDRTPAGRQTRPPPTRTSAREVTKYTSVSVIPNAIRESLNVPSSSPVRPRPLRKQAL